MTLPPGFENFAWFGRGPHENYVDRNMGAAVGLYKGSVDEQYVPFARRLRELAKGFEERAVLALVERYMEKDR